MLNIYQKDWSINQCTLWILCLIFKKKNINSKTYKSYSIHSCYSLQFMHACFMVQCILGGVQHTYIIHMYRPWEFGALIAVIFQFFAICTFSNGASTISLTLSPFSCSLLHTPILCVCVCLLCEYLYYVVFNPMFVGAIIQYSLYIFFFYSMLKINAFFLQLVGVAFVVDVR